ncbi:hypothetical protein SEA_WOLLYPOG_28 [Arthrobacter phage Wollypog]|uniref:Uncharacterized protein n=1 Tax=Arthrobacter phage Wollypog TaxID=2790985 RepID=A0A7T3KCH3_9CAUD|nr:hypothetical protein PP291_gp28 [Arthrobacter phage Wollypog]QPX62580.1 hypothetical protein SEA_WOLLYPOG_28 [Arthrobacter phage Wollypog]
MSKHAAKINPADPKNALCSVPRFEPQSIDAPVGSEEYNEALKYHESAQWDVTQGFETVLEAAKKANDYMRYARYNHRNTQLELAAEQNYASLVLSALYLQCRMEEWGMPTSWTDGVVDEDGFVRVYNAGSEEIQCWQGGDMDEIRVDEHGIGMRNA